MDTASMLNLMLLSGDVDIIVFATTSSSVLPLVLS